jgi:excisionase family DNA binding protein
MAQELQPLLRAEQVGKILGKHPRTVLVLARSGALPCVRLGHRTVRFRSEDVQAFIEKRAS